MKKFLLLAALAASFSSASADDFSDIFALTCDNKPVAEGQTITVRNYSDPIVSEFPEFANQPGYESKYESQAVIKAENISDEPWILHFTLTRETPAIEEYPIQGSPIGAFKLCYGYGEVAGNCLNIDNNQIAGFTNRSVDVEEYAKFDIDQVDFQNVDVPVTLKLVLDVVDGYYGKNDKGNDIFVVTEVMASRTLNVKYTHENDITMGVEDIVADTEAAYYTLQGVRVAQPQKGNIYIVRTANGTTKKLF